MNADGAFYVTQLPDNILEEFRSFIANLTNWMTTNEMYLNEELYKQVRLLQEMFSEHTRILSPGAHQIEGDQSWRREVATDRNKIRECVERVRAALREVSYPIIP